MDCTECIKKQILNSEDKAIEIEYLEVDDFHNERIIKTIIISNIVGYKYIQDYIWEEVYNDIDAMGGYACVSIIESVVTI
jgi:hypothetical protein